MDVSKASFEERPKGFHQKNKIKNTTKSSIDTLQGILLPNIVRDNKKRDPSTLNFEHLPSVSPPSGNPKKVDLNIRNLYLRYSTFKQIRWNHEIIFRENGKAITNRNNNRKNKHRHPNQIRSNTPARDFHKKHNRKQTKLTQKQDERGKNPAEDPIKRNDLN